MDADQEDGSSQACGELFLAELNADAALSESSAEGTEESSSEDEDVWPAARASSRSGKSEKPSTEHTAADPAIPRYAGRLIPRVGPVKLKSCKVGQVRDPCYGGSASSHSRQ